jgi:hypothetical protein
MTTSELWAKAEAEKRYPFPLRRHQDPIEATRLRSGNNAFAAGVLHVLSLLESEQAVEAAAQGLYESADRQVFDSADEEHDAIRAAIAAAVAAITNQEPGGGSET